MHTIAKSIPEKYRARIAHWDDERSEGNSLIVSLAYGWRFINTDCHTCGEDTVKDMLDQLRMTEPCACADCLNGLATAEEKTKEKNHD